MNKFYARNFSPRPEFFSDSVDVTDFSHSDCIYEANKGITHAIVKDASGKERIASDIEICIGSDPEVTSMFSTEHTAILRNAILSKPHNKLSNLDSDGNPIGGFVTPNGLERDELANVIESRTAQFNHDAVDLINSHISAPEPSAPEPSQTE